MTWIPVPETRIKHHHTLSREHVQEMKGMLAFVQQSQHVSLDHLLQSVLSWYLKRKRFDFPLYGETERLQFTLPESIHQELDELVVARQHTDPEATVTHVLEHAIMSYLSSHGALPKAWKEEKKRVDHKASSTPTTPDSSVAPQPPRKDTLPVVKRPQEHKPKGSDSSTTSVSSSYAKPVVQTPTGLHTC